MERRLSALEREDLFKMGILFTLDVVALKKSILSFWGSIVTRLPLILSISGAIVAWVPHLLKKSELSIEKILFCHTADEFYITIKNVGDFLAHDIKLLIYPTVHKTQGTEFAPDPDIQPIEMVVDGNLSQGETVIIPIHKLHHNGDPDIQDSLNLSLSYVAKCNGIRLLLGEKQYNRTLIWVFKPFNQTNVKGDYQMYRAKHKRS